MRIRIKLANVASVTTHHGNHITVELEGDGREITPEIGAILDDLFPNSQCQIEKLLQKEALIACMTDNPHLDEGNVIWERPSLEQRLREERAVKRCSPNI